MVNKTSPKFVGVQADQLRSDCGDRFLTLSLRASDSDHCSMCSFLARPSHTARNHYLLFQPEGRFLESPNCNCALEGTGSASVALLFLPVFDAGLVWQSACIDAMGILHHHSSSPASL